MERRRRTSLRLAGLAAGAAVPALLLTGCSSGSGSGGDDAGSSPSGSATAPRTTSAAPVLAPVKYRTLPNACQTVSRDTVTALVPKAKVGGGTATKTSEMQARGGCSWTGNGSDGYQYRWLSVTLQRFDSDAQLGSGQDQATKRYGEQVAALGAVKGFTSSPVAGVGDQATSVAGRATVAHVTSQNDTVVARSGNVVVIVEYNGAGLEGKKNPSATTVVSGAQRAVKDVVAAVAAANG